MHDMVNSVKVAVGVVIATLGSGITSFLDIVPKEIGTYATTSGLVLSMVLIFTHLRRDRREAIKAKLEIEIMRRKEQGGEDHF